MKPIKQIVYIPFIIAFMFGCGFKINISDKPQNLEEAMEYFQHHWSKEQLKTFSEKEEQIAVVEVHFGAAMWVRNHWVYGYRNKAFRKYFNDMGIFAPDDISSILFTSLHRRLNNKDIELDKQVEFYKNYWKTMDTDKAKDHD